MTVAEYIIDFLINKGVTDIFGIPGGTVLDILYSADKRSDKIKAHLSYHEQGAAMAACGYAQASDKLGVAYANRGPGFTNMITGIADAYYDSIPVLFITAHSAIGNPKMRTEYDQEMDSVSIVSKITKYAKKISSVSEVASELEIAYKLAMNGRKGPVFLDFSTQVLSQNIQEFVPGNNEITTPHADISEIVEQIVSEILHAKRPILLIGDGIHQSNTEEFLKKFVEKNNIPVISSRFSFDILNNSDKYFGYVGSHAIRYANFILSKADLVVSLGNRLNFPLNSDSYSPLIRDLRFVRIDNDETEFLRDIPHSKKLKINLQELMPVLSSKKIDYADCDEWLKVCNTLKSELFDTDMSEPVVAISKFLFTIGQDSVITSDVGNNEFWLARACVHAHIANRVIFSKSFGALGCSLPKAIGAYYSTNKPIICFTGDQGIQMNMQELQCIAQNNLPIKIVVINNHTSGMIKDRQAQKYGSHFVHTTKASGYSELNLEKMAQLYNLEFISLSKGSDYTQVNKILSGVIELNTTDKYHLEPTLKKGDLCQNLFPYLETDIYEKLNML